MLLSRSNAHHFRTVLIDSLWQAGDIVIILETTNNQTNNQTFKGLGF